MGTKQNKLIFYLISQFKKKEKKEKGKLKLNPGIKSTTFDWEIPII